MSDATKLPLAAELVLYQFSNKDAPKPKLAAPIDEDDTTLTFSTPLKDEDGTIIVGKAFPIGIKKSNGWTETCLITSGILLYDAQTANFTVGDILTGGTSGAKALIVEDTDAGTTGTLNLIITSGTFQTNETITDSAGGSATANGTLTNSVSADGLTIANVIRGIDPGSIDYITGNSDFADSHNSQEPIFCNIPAFIPELLRSVLQGLIASGGSDFIIGTDEAGTVTVSRSTGVGTKVGFMRWDATTSKAQYSNDGSAWTSIDDVVSSVLFKISATDTTSAYALTKLIGGTGITITQTDTGGNETLVITTTLPDIIDAHEIYTPAFLTGDIGAETTIALWDNLADASFRGTIDGTAYNVDGIDMTATGPLGIVADMDEVAAVIQHYLRIETSGTETCAWSTDHLIITSADTTVASEISVLETSTGTVGVDISGAGADDWMDCDAGNGVATDRVLDPTEDENKIVILNSSGQFANGFISESSVSQHLSVPISTGEDVVAGNALRIKIDGKAYKADEDPVQGMIREIIINSDSSGNTACQIDTNKIVYIYHVATALTGIVYTWDGEQFTAGAEKIIDANAGAVTGDVCVDVVSHATNAFTVVQWDDGATGVDDATAWACTVATNTITAGLPTVVDSGTQTVGSAHSICSPAAGKVTISYSDTVDSKTNAITGTISGTTITFGAIIEVAATDCDEHLDNCEIGTDKIVTAYRGTDDDLYARVATISTITMTQGAALELEDAITVTSIRMEKVEDDKFIVIYNTGSEAKLIVCTVSGTTITKGTPISISSVDSFPNNIKYFEDNKVAIMYGGDTFPEGIVNYDYLNIIVGWVTTDGTVPTVHQICRLDRTYNPLTSLYIYKTEIVKVNDDMFQLVLSENTGKDIYVQNIADNNFIGFADSSESSGDEVEADFLYNSNQTGLTPGAKYYLADSGALALTGIVPAGMAVSATKIIKN